MAVGTYNPTGYGYGTAPSYTGPTLSQISRPGAMTTIKSGGGGASKNYSAGGIISGVGDIYTGISTFRASRTLAADQRAEGDILYAEAIRTARIIIEEGQRFAAGQSLQYIGSGVQIAGSALVTIAQTKKYAATEAAAVKSRGEALRRKARTTAERTESEGRASLVSGILGGVTSIFI